MLSYKANIEIGDVCVMSFPVSKDINQLISNIIDEIFIFYKGDMVEILTNEKMYKLLNTYDICNNEDKLKKIVYSKINNIKKLKEFLNIIICDDLKLNIFF